MKNRYNLFIGTMLFACPILAQYDDVLMGANNVRTQITNNGVFFNNVTSNSPSYEIPIDSEKHLIYSSTFWFGGKDIADQLKIAGSLYGLGHDLFPGALRNDGSASAPLGGDITGIYSVYKSEIDYHITHYTADDYTIPTSISNWPAHGNIAEGVDLKMAPFVDLNGNTFYEPELGDHPKIPGDYATFLVMNDNTSIHTESGGDPLGIEIHYLFYQYATNDDLDNTVFLKMKVINRGTQFFPEFIVGNFTDVDPGGTQKYIGSNPDKNLVYSYFGTPNDAISYGENPPAFGILYLNNRMNMAGYINSGGGPYGMPNNPNDYWNYMNARWLNGLPFMYGGNGNTTAVGPAVNFLYDGALLSGETWNELSQGHLAGERKIISATEPMSLNPGEVLCYDYAFIYDRSGNHLENAVNLNEVAENIQTFYNEQTDLNCDFYLNIEEKNQELNTVNIYPNPSNGTFQINLDGEFDVILYNVDGKLVYQAYKLTEFDLIAPHLESGTYFVLVEQEGAIHQSRLIIY